MKNNIHEDKKFNCDIKAFHANLIENFNLPNSIFTINCPYCSEKLTPYSIRGINFKLNSRNFGDLSIDFMCEKCEIGDSMYVRNAFENISDIKNILDSNKKIDYSTCFIEEKMYQMQYNNVLEKMINSKK